jgi:hypothetical protein
MMVKGIKEIYDVQTYTAFFTRIGFTEGAEVWITGSKADRLCEELRGAVKRSESHGYHRRAGTGDLQRLAQQRMRVEPGFQPAVVPSDRFERVEYRPRDGRNGKDGGYRRR